MNVEFVINDIGQIVLLKNAEEFNKRFPARSVKKLNNGMLYIQSNAKKFFYDITELSNGVSVITLPPLNINKW